jgi:hypothetical protein
MATLEGLHVRIAAGLLDDAAGEILDLALEPTKDHIRLLADAMAGIFDVQQAIYRLRPELKPAFCVPGRASTACGRRRESTAHSRARRSIPAV